MRFYRCVGVALAFLVTVAADARAGFQWTGDWQVANSGLTAGVTPTFSTDPASTAPNLTASFTVDLQGDPNPAPGGLGLVGFGGTTTFSRSFSLSGSSDGWLLQIGEVVSGGGFLFRAAGNLHANVNVSGVGSSSSVDLTLLQSSGNSSTEILLPGDGSYVLTGRFYVGGTVASSALSVGSIHATYYNSAGIISVTAVPEPSSLALAAIGVGLASIAVARSTARS